MRDGRRISEFMPTLAWAWHPAVDKSEMEARRTQERDQPASEQAESAR